MADAGMGSYIMNSGTFILSGYSELCGNIRIEAGEIGITRVDAGSSGSVELTAANGSILAGRVTGVNITGGDLMITAFDGIGNSLNPVLTKVENLTGLAESGSFFISEYRDLNLVDVRAGVDISITCAAGNMVVTYVSAGRDVYLTSLDGSINGEISKIYGQNVFLTMSGGILTEVVSPEPIITVRESLPAPVIDNETYLRAVGAVNELWMSSLSSIPQWMTINTLIIRTEQVLFVTPKANSIFVVEGEE